MTPRKEFEDDLYMISSYSQILARAEVAQKLFDFVPKPFGLATCHHDDWVKHADKEKKDYITYFFNKWSPKDE